MIEDDIVKLLKGPHSDAEPVYADRVYPDMLPENVSYPACVYEINSSEVDEDWGGPNGFESHSLTVTLHAASRPVLKSATDFLVQHLNNFDGSSFESGSGGAISLDNTCLDIQVRPANTFHEPATDVFVQQVELEIHIQN